MKVWIVFKIKAGAEYGRMLRVFDNAESAKKFVHYEIEDQHAPGTWFVIEETEVRK